MRFPKMRPQTAMELKIPDLSGGLNFRDGLSEVLDNQLTDCKNVWWNDGVLKTRPGMRADNETVIYIDRPSKQHVKIRNFPEIDYVESGKRYFLQVIERSMDSDQDGIYTIDLQFAWQSNNKTKKLDLINLSNNFDEINYFVCCKNNILYCFTGNANVYKLDITDLNNKWEMVKEEDYYIPIVYAHCTAVNFTGTQVEGFNLIGNKFKMIYSTINPNLKPVTADDGSGNVSTVHLHEMIYPFPEGMITNPEDYIGKEVKAIITDESGNKEVHRATFTDVFVNDNGTGIEGFEKDSKNGLIMQITGKDITFWWDQGGGVMEPATISSDAIYIEDNLEIIMPYVPTAEEKAKIFNMTRCEWFGGAASGIAGGTRLFLCGNSGEDKSLVYWSGLNNPLYFPENSYFYVGDTTSAVTGFGKQSDKLVIFKENETWCTFYQQNNNIDDNSLINQSVIDYASSSVYFPLMQINSNIGCKYPDTIQLCRNRLVWLSDNGNVYTLVSESQYNERSIFCVSEMVKNRLNKYNGISHPTACDWNGYYCLCFNDEMYLMDYNCYGYTHVASYSKTEDANIRIPWYFWKFAISGVISAIDDKIIFSYYHDGESFKHCAIVNNVLSTDNDSKDIICYEEWDKEELSFAEKDIESKATTKLFDFGQPNHRKNVDKINLQLGNNGGEPIKVKIITECGEEEQEIALTGNETQSYTAGYIDSKAVFPCIRQTVKIGLELSSIGILAIDGMSFKFRTTGGTR